MPEITEELSIEFTVKCELHNTELTADVTTLPGRYGSKDRTVTVVACEQCLEAAREAARAEGYAEGRAEAEEEARV